MLIEFTSVGVHEVAPPFRHDYKKQAFLARSSCSNARSIASKLSRSWHNFQQTAAKKIANALVGYFLWQGLKDDYQTYRELNSLQGVYGNMILL